MRFSSDVTAATQLAGHVASYGAELVGQGSAIMHREQQGLLTFA